MQERLWEGTKAATLTGAGLLLGMPRVTYWYVPVIGSVAAFLLMAGLWPWLKRLDAKLYPEGHERPMKKENLLIPVFTASVLIVLVSVSYKAGQLPGWVFRMHLFSCCVLLCHMGVKYWKHGVE